VHALVVVRVPERALELVEQRGTERVAPLRAVQRDPRAAVLDGVENVLVRHRASSERAAYDSAAGRHESGYAAGHRARRPG
jgi:hypothetical protein